MNLTLVPMPKSLEEASFACRQDLGKEWPMSYYHMSCSFPPIEEVSILESWLLPRTVVRSLALGYYVLVGVIMNFMLCCTLFWCSLD